MARWDRWDLTWDGARRTLAWDLDVITLSGFIALCHLLITLRTGILVC